MKNLVKTLLVALVVVFMIGATVLTASAAPTLPAKNQHSMIKSTEIQRVATVNFHNSTTTMEKSNNQDVKIDLQKNDDFTMTMPWALPNPTGWTNPNARANSFC